MAVQKLADEAKLAVNFRKDFIWLNQELKYVRGFLQDAAQRSRHRKDVKQWLENIRVIALSAEDISEECAVESMYGNNAQCCGLSCNQCIVHSRIGWKIKDIKDRIKSIIEEGNQLKLCREVLSADEALSTMFQSVTVHKKRSSLPPSDSPLVGIQSKVDDMLSLLENPALIVIAVVGMGGIGKTYLLQHVYTKAKERYEKSIWLSVSQSYSVSNLQKDLAFQLDEDLSKQIKKYGVSEQESARLIREKMQGKRCLVVLDDVWRATREEDLLSILGLSSGNNSQCKILVTTRSKDVCTNLDAIIYEMQRFSEEESYSLFCFRAFRKYEGNRATLRRLEEVGREIVKQCEKLPLAIETIAASLANTTIPREWELKLHQLNRVVNVDHDRIMSILGLSYDSLPARLKECFAYLSFFPKNEVIECEYLINLWIGEGIILAGEEQWDVAWDCLYQLANLCLLQLWEEVKDEELTKYCKIHYLLLDLAIHISRENKCVFSVEEASTHTSGGTGCCRILLAKKDIDDNAISKRRPICLRTLSLAQNEEITSIPANLFTAMRGLRVLDLSSTSISALPASVGKMRLLKVLNLRRTEIREVPKCVRHLKSLLFLSLSDRCSRLPVWISELKCLQHLQCENIDRMPKAISKLDSLRKLRSEWLELSIEEDELMSLEDLANMTQLQELRLRIKHEIELKRMEEGILALLVKMRRLGISNGIGHGMELPQFPENMRAMEHLESFRLVSFAVPSWICELRYLRELILINCECSDYPELQRMPNLVSLWIRGNSGCRELPKGFGKSGGFPCLRFFAIISFKELEEFPELEEGAMQCLEEFNLLLCPYVKKVGDGLERLKKLKKFNYSRSGTNEIKKTLKIGGEYWNKIKAINPQVSIIN